MEYKRFKGKSISEIIELWNDDCRPYKFLDWYIKQVAYDIAYKIDCELQNELQNELQRDDGYDE